ncbi:hypothetical protein [Vibrio quintilis]|uniref:Uncharacterized protein n=1 Tax=Vibrio quintilis TaxID=1117707 RepID=A0A1M7YYW8_9VIBR|nr:hypothetical protein [Vibrio quintilis]SHO57666.1 hypothetical protein VQ7734_03436 [Vibrio quintilis]
MKVLPYYKEETKRQCSAAISLVDNINVLSKKESAIVTNYMSSCLIIDQWLSNGMDILTREYVIPTQLWSDGIYVWNESHIYYVRKYRAKLPSAFISHIYEQVDIGYDPKGLNIGNLITKYENISKKISEGDESFYDISYE